MADSVVMTRWGTYLDYEGPWHPGRHVYAPATPDSDADAKLLTVITATEGGTYDACNRYDACIDTQGVIQWCNRAPQRSCDRIYAEIMRQHPQALTELREWLRAHGYDLVNADGIATFTSPRYGAVTTQEAQRRLYFGSSGRGKVGTWTEESKAYAKEFVSVSTRVWDSAGARAVQEKWTVARLRTWFTTASIRPHLEARPKTPWSDAYYAVFLSFASNNPAAAAAAAVSGIEDMMGMGPDPWTGPWVTELCRRHVVGPSIAIYPERWRKIVGIVNTLYGVDLPPLKELIATETELPLYADVVEIQRALKLLGFDLGPKNFDGIWGAKTGSAYLAFLRARGYEVQSPLPSRFGMEALTRAVEARLNLGLDTDAATEPEFKAV